MLTPPVPGFNKNLWQIHLRDGHKKFPEKNEVDNNLWVTFHGFIGLNKQNSFQQTHTENFFVSITTVQSFEFGNGSRMSDKKLVILEFKYLQNKKW